MTPKHDYNCIALYLFYSRLFGYVWYLLLTSSEIRTISNTSRDSYRQDRFCESFDASDWKSEVEKIVKLHFRELTLLMSYIKYNYNKMPSGCVALFNRYNLMGLYCLGTLSPFRGQGIAKNMIKKSLRVARQENLDFLFLQTFDKEGLIKFYKRMGFQIAYNKKIYVLYNNRLK